MAWKKQKPLFVLFEGGEGSGKTTQANLLFHRLKRSGRQVRYNDEPGSTALGFKIRTALLGAEERPDPLAEFLLFEADRALDFETNVIPALRQGFDVVQDRCFGSTFAYQGYGRGLIKKYGKLMREVDNAARKNVYPDLIFLLDIDPAKALRRIARQTSFEKEKPAFHRLVRRGFLAQAKAGRGRWVVLDALKPAKLLHEKIWTRAEKLLRE